MRKIITTVVTAVVLLCANAVMVSADRSDEPCNKDYRKQPIYDVNGVEATKPIAEFKIKRLRNGELMDELLSDSGYDLDNPFPTMECYVGDTIVFEDLSNPKSGDSISVWDFQYYGTLGDKWNEYKYNILDSASFELTEPGETAFFLCVKSNLRVKYGSLDAWSDNGSHQTTGTNRWFPRGMYWYFASARIVVKSAPEAKVHVRYWNVPLNTVFYEEEVNLGELIGDGIISTTVHIEDKPGYKITGWNVQTPNGDTQYTGEEQDVGIELAPWNPEKYLNIECMPLFVPELRVRIWDTETDSIMSENTLYSTEIMTDSTAEISYTPEEIEGYSYEGWTVELTDGSIEREGNDSPVTVTLSEQQPLKYLNVKYHPGDGGEPPPDEEEPPPEEIITVTPPSGECDGEIEWTETSSHRVRNGYDKYGRVKYKTCSHTFKYRTTLSATGELTPTTFKSGYGFETSVSYSISTSLISNSGGCSSWGNSRRASSTVSDPTIATVYVPWTMTNSLGTQPQAISMEKSGNTFILPVSPVSEAGARKIYTDVSLPGTEEEPVEHSVEIYISGGGVGEVEFCKKLTLTFTINGDMYSDDFSGMN